jgi:uncharacterized membrane protein
MLLFAICMLVSSVIPPFQSPDEFEHITRAYLLTRGEIVLSAPSGQSSGGMIDTGLARYMDAHSQLPFHPDRKLTKEQTASAKQIAWTGDVEFRPALGMAYYFPGVYVVHAIGLKLGELMGASVSRSYQVTRALLLTTICLLLFYSFQLAAPSYLVMTLLLLPMSIFQFASASLDGIATALAIFIVSVFIRSGQDSRELPRGLAWWALFAWTLLASSRQQMFPLVLLLLAVAYRPRRIYLMAGAVLAALAVVGWQVLMLKTVVDGRVALGATSGEIIWFYLKNPVDLLLVLERTLTNESILRGYFSSFFGMLGWLDTPFKGAEYLYLLAVTILFAILSIDALRLQSCVFERAVLLLTAVCSVLIVFLAMLVNWTPHPADVIDGVVGRYLLVPALLFAYAISHLDASVSTARWRLAIWACVGLFGIWATVITVQLLADRYYILVKPY